MIIENVRLGKKQVLKIIQNGQVIWEYDNRLSLDTGTIETFTFDNVSLDMLTLRILQANSNVSNAVSTGQANLGTIIMWPMKATADISESTTNVVWQATPTEPLSISFMSGYVGDVELTDAFAEKLYVLCTSRANTDTTMLASTSGVLIGNVISQHSENVTLLTPDSPTFDFNTDISTGCEVELTRPLTEQLGNATISRVSKRVVLSHPSAKQSKVEIETDTTSEAKLKSDSASKLKLVTHTDTSQDTKLHRAIQSNVQHAKNILSKILVAMDWLQGNERLKYIDAFIETLSTQYSQMIRSESVDLGKHSMYSESLLEGTLSIIDKIIMSGITELSNSGYISDAELPLGTALGEFNELVKSDHIARFNVRENKVFGDFSDLLKTDHQATASVSISKIITEFDELLKTTYYGSVEICRLLDLMYCVAALKTSHDAALQRAATVNLTEFNEMSASSDSASIGTTSVLRVVVKDVARSTADSRMATPELIVVGNYKSTMTSKYYASLSFDGVDDLWLDPIQTGNNLYIRQTYEDPLQEGTNLDISEVYFEPVHEGSNLYIISAQSLGGE